jgi:FkbM family methyltransferase
MYSQNHEESVILSHFGNYIGSLLDIGSNDGATLSNSRQLILNGWVGDLVEPSPRAFKKLMQLYNNNNSLTLHNIAITNEDKQAVLYESDTHLNKGDVGLLSSTVVSEMNRWQNETFTPVKVPGKRFASFLKMATFKTYDFISIDAEGNDLIILQQMNLDELKCSCLCIEWNGSKELENKYRSYMLNYSMYEIHRNAENIIYVKSK